jgi:hypothetical protein
MKLEENRPINDTIMTKPTALVSMGRTEKPIACAKKDESKILLLFPVLSSIPPQTGERIIVSIAGMSERSEMRRYEAFNDLKCIGRNAQVIPVGPKARAVES